MFIAVVCSCRTEAAREPCSFSPSQAPPIMSGSSLHLLPWFFHDASIIYVHLSICTVHPSSCHFWNGSLGFLGGICLFGFASGIEFSGKEAASSLGIEGLLQKLDCRLLESLLPITVCTRSTTVTRKIPKEDTLTLTCVCF